MGGFSGMTPAGMGARLGSGLVKAATGGKSGGKKPGTTPDEDAPPITSYKSFQDMLDNYHKGGTVRKTGPAMLKQGEKVLTKKQARTRAQAQKMKSKKSSAGRKSARKK